MKKFLGTVLFFFTCLLAKAQLTIYSGLNLQGSSANCVVDTIYIGNNISNNLNNAIQSISLNKGFMATLAENEDGTGERFSYMANKTNININLAFVLQNKISFIRVIKLPSLVIKKKGSANQKNTDHAALNATWFYDWGPGDVSTPTVNFTPMFWSTGHASQNNINAVIAKDSLTHVLSFNEPDHDGQANMTNATAIPLYKNLLRIGQRMGSPACTEGQHRVWLDTFVNAAKRDSLQIDFIADHWYDWGAWLSSGNPNENATNIFNRFKTYINNLYDFHKKPIWLTEFNANVNRLPAVHEAFMALALPWLDANPNVERYAYFFGNDYPLYTSSGTLTPGAVFYANHASVNAYPENIVDTRPATPITLATWEPSAITNGGGTATFAASTLETNMLSPTPLTRGSGLSAAVSANAGYWGAQGWSTATTPAPGISANDFITFGLKSKNSKSVNYQSIDKLNIRIQASGPIQYYIDYNVDNGMYRPIDTIRGPAPVTGNYILGPINLANVPGLQDVSSASTVTFRITPFNATSSASNFLIGSGNADTNPDLVLTGGYSDANTITTSASNADLSALTLSAGTLSPTFAAATNSYMATVSNATSSLTIIPTKANVNATIEVRVNGGSYALVNSGNASTALNLNIGNNTIEVRVTAQGGSPIKVYTVTVNRQSNNADLSALTLSTGTLSPIFASATTAYTATLGSGTSSITITPTKANENATIEMRSNGGSYVEIVSGFATSAITIFVGNNLIDLRITSQDGSTVKTYTVNVLRPSNDADLSNLTIGSGTLSPAFAIATITYTATPTNASTVSITPTVDEANATVEIRSNSGTWSTVPSGVASSVSIANISANNTINVRVTAQNGTTTKTYTITIRRLSTNNNLTSMVLSGGTLSPTFNANTTTYSTATNNSSISITPTSTSSFATIEARVNAENFVSITSGNSSNALPLTIGTNTVEVKITAEDGTAVRTYTITVNYTLPLPLQLTSFVATANRQNGAVNEVHIKWTTANEVNTASANIQVSTNGNNFTTIGSINSVGIGNGSYQYNHLLTANYLTAKQLYYRLQLLDKDGKFTFSEIVKVGIDILQVTNHITVYPNPVTSKMLHIDFGETITKPTTFYITNMVGKIVQQGILNTRQQKVQLNNLPANNYILKVDNKEALIVVL